MICRVLVVVFVFLISCKSQKVEGTTPKKTNVKLKNEITSLLDNWHNAAANTNFDAYFGTMASNGIFIGTDASENWTVEEFKAYAKPHFDKGKAWGFKALDRNIYLSDTKKIAWFDELLDTRMGLCRGSGVVQQVNRKWKLVHYVLSITIPNEKVSETILLKKALDSTYKNTLRKSIN